MTEAKIKAAIERVREIRADIAGTDNRTARKDVEAIDLLIDAAEALIAVKRTIP